MFEDSLVESRVSGAKKTATVMVSALAHVAFVAALIVVPLLITDALPAGGGTGMGGILLAPGGWGSAPDIAPPPPRGSATPRASSPESRSADAVELTQETPITEEAVLVADPSVVLPRTVPDRIASLSGAGNPLGVDGGEPNGIVGGRIGGTGFSLIGIPGGNGPGCGPLGCGMGGFGPGGPGSGDVLGNPTAPPPPAKPVAAAPTPKPVPPPPPVNVPAPPPILRVGEGPQMANCIRCPAPDYPSLARTAGVTDTVVLSARINKQGKIEGLTVVRGHVLLRDAAVRAVSEWQYRPTMLNGEPVEVQTTISIAFVFRR